MYSFCTDAVTTVKPFRLDSVAHPLGDLKDVRMGASRGCPEKYGLHPASCMSSSIWAVTSAFRKLISVQGLSRPEGGVKFGAEEGVKFHAGLSCAQASRGKLKL